MPFQSEKQRRYLWANEPEIARDWADTYGSRIKKDDGGIMRVGFASGRFADSGPMSPGTSATGGTHAGGYGRSNTSDSQNNQPNKPDDRFQQYSKNIVNIPPPKEGGDWEDQRPKKEGFKFTPPLKFVIDQAKKFKNWNNAKRRQQWWEKYNKENPTGILPPGMDPSKYAFSDWENWNEDDWNNPENLKLLEELGYNPHQPTGTGGGDGPQGYMGYPSYAAWLAAQGRGGTTEVAEVIEEPISDFQKSLTTGANSPFDYYVGSDPTAANKAWGKQMGVDPRTMGMTSYAADGGRIPAAYGGIMDTATGRRAYGFGSFFKKIGRAAKKVLKSPIAKGALMAGLGAYGMGWGPFGAKGMFSGARGAGFLSNMMGGDLTNKLFMKNIAKKGAEAAYGANPTLSLGKLGIWGAGALPFILGGEEEDDDPKFDYNKVRDAYADELRRIKSAAMAGTLDQNEWNYLGVKDGGRIGLSNGGDPLLREEYDKYVFEMKEMGLEPMSFEQFKEQARAGMYAGGQSIPSDYTIEDAMMTTTQDKLGGITDVMKQADLSRAGDVGQFYAADGGRIGADEGGLMDLGGMEKDYRNDGGFVPIGGEEKADDVPARLSRNEFVFTADAVRGAGDGDIDKGAEIMENVMKNLEQGGQISEETQGLAGAQEMFDVSERLSEVV